MNRFRTAVAKSASSIATELDMLAAVQPLATLTYADQLAAKQRDCSEILAKLAREFKAAGCAPLDADVLQPIRESPQTHLYRNKCELAIGVTADTDDITVGFTCGRRPTDNRFCIFPVTDKCLFVPVAMRAAAECFQVGEFQAETHLIHRRRCCAPNRCRSTRRRRTQACGAC